MSGVNKVILIGHLGKDPELKGRSENICVFSVATSKSWRDKDSGERKDRTEWHSIVSYSDNSNKFAMQYLKKGSKVYIEGELQTRKYDDKEGVTRYRTEIILEAFGSKLISVEAIKSDNKPAGQERTDLDDEIQF